MIRVSALIVAVCMLVIAGSLGAFMFLTFGLSLAEASIVALAALTGLALYNAVSGQRSNHDTLATQIAELSRQTGDLSQHMTEQVGRLAALEHSDELTTARIAVAVKPIHSEIVELGSLVQQLAETSVAHDAALRDPFAAHRAAANSGTLPEEAEAEPFPAPIAAPAVASPAADHPRPVHAPAAVPVAAATIEEELPVEIPEAIDPDIAASGPFQGLHRDTIITLIREAIDDNRIDLHLQPIVMLPQRKVRFYEGVMRLRLPDGALIPAANFLGFAESGGLMPGIDLAMVQRCARVVRRLMSKNREVGLFCNLSATTLSDAVTSAELVEFLRADRALNQALIFELRQATLRALSEQEEDSIAALGAAGFQLSIDHVVDLRLDLHHLATRGCRFIKIPANLLLAPGNAAGDIDPTDLPGLLKRYGIELIAEKIEQEATVADLLDYDVRFAQGNLFAPPRPVRPEVMQSEPAAIPVTPSPPAAARAEPARVAVAAERVPSKAERISALTQMARRVARNAG